MSPRWVIWLHCCYKTSKLGRAKEQMQYILVYIKHHHNAITFTWQLQNVPGITLLLTYTKQCNHLHYISVKTVPLCNYARLPSTVKVLDTFLEDILCERLFRSSGAFLISVASQKRRHLVLVSVQGTRKNQLDPGQESTGDTPVLSLCSLLRNPWPTPTSVLERCWGKTNCRFSTFQAFPSDRIPNATKDDSVHFFIHSSNSCKFDQRISGTFWS